MPRNTSAMSILSLLLVLLLGIGVQTYASEFSLPILHHRHHLHHHHRHHHRHLGKPPQSTGTPIKDRLQEKLANMSYHVEWVCQENNPSNPKCPGNKFSWPELVGKKGKDAEAMILRENPYIEAVDYAPQDANVADKYCCNRVRLVMNCDPGCDYDNATVFQAPIVG